MPWLQLDLEANPDTAGHLAELLQTAGAAAVTLQDAADQPLFEPPPGTTPLWNTTRVIGLFAADTDIPSVLDGLEQQLAPAPLPPWHLNPLEDRDWVRAWMDNFQPMRFGEHLWICPSGFTPPQPQAVNILLDPGLAFGTGTHPTTAMCLRWLDAHPPRDLSVIDYGCGSGILGIAACKLGARRVIGVDTDPQAILATHANAEKNQVGACVRACLPTEFRSEPVPLLLANILAGPLQSLAPRFAELVAPSGYLVLSGILAEQADEVRQHYQFAFNFEPETQQDEWVCLVAQRR